MQGIFSIMIRAVLILIKFGFLILFTKYTTVENVGVYALLVSFLTLSVFAFGAELHASACRGVVIEKKISRRNVIFSTHSFFVFVVFALVAVIYLLFSYFGYLSGWYWMSFTFVLLCFLELYSQEIGRYLLMMEKPIASNIVQLIKGGAWSLPALYLISTKPIDEHIDIILNCWYIATFLSVLVGLYCLKDKVFFIKKIDFSWLCKALRESRLYWFIAILGQWQMYADRFVLNYFSGPADVGILSVFQNFTNVIQTFIQVGVIGILLPKLISKYHDRQYSEFKSYVKKMLSQTLFITLILSVLLVLFIKIVLEVIDKEIYLQSLDIFYLQLISSIFLILSLIPHIVLYSMRADKQLFSILVLGFPFYLLGLVLFTYFYGMHGLVLSTIIYNFLLMLFETIIAIKFFKGGHNASLRTI